MVLLLFLHANADMQRGKNTSPCQLALQEHLAAAGTRLLQVHSPDKFTTPIPSSSAVCFSGVIARCAGDCWTTLSLFLFFSSVSPYSVPLVPTFKHNKIDNEIQVLKTLFFFFFKGNLQMILLFPMTVWSLMTNFLQKFQESNCNVTSLIFYMSGKKQFCESWCSQFPSCAALALLNFLKLF